MTAAVAPAQPEPAAVTEPRCSFCRRTRLEVTKLMIDEPGRNGCCDECFVTLARGFASTR